jgi:hypothetical protein
MVFENGVKNIQAVAYNGARTVYHASLKSFKFILTLSTIQKPPKWLVVRALVARVSAPASTPVHGAHAASDFYGECSSLVSVPKVVSAIQSLTIAIVFELIYS